jgi:hypothetical protein
MCTGSVARGFRELFDAGGDVDGLADQGELELAAAADGAGDHHTGGDSDADAKGAVESLGDEALNQNSSGHGGISAPSKHQLNPRIFGFPAAASVYVLVGA